MVSYKLLCTGGNLLCFTIISHPKIKNAGHLTGNGSTPLHFRKNSGVSPVRLWAQGSEVLVQQLGLNYPRSLVVFCRQSPANHIPGRGPCAGGDIRALSFQLPTLTLGGLCLPLVCGPDGLSIRCSRPHQRRAQPGRSPEPRAGQDEDREKRGPKSQVWTRLGEVWPGGPLRYLPWEAE